MPQGLSGGLLLADTVALHLGFSLLLGSLASDIWLRSADSTWCAAVRRVNAGVRRRAGVAGLLTSIIAVWLQGAEMAEVGLPYAGPATLVLLRDTDFGHLALAGMLAWCGVAAAGWKAGPWGPGRAIVIGAGLAAWVCTRGAVSHAGALGGLTLDLVVDAIHLALTALWVGIVVLASLVRLTLARASDQGRQDAIHWLTLLSATATGALSVVMLTGAFKLWKTLAGPAGLGASGYYEVLGTKLVLVGMAAALGGINRFGILPPLLGRLRDGADSGGPVPWQARLTTVLRVESLLLVLALAAAATLSGLEPP
jgi:putative copper resistance protein D